MNEGYFEYEHAKGNMLVSSSGSLVASSNSGALKTLYFSPEDVTHPGLENGNVFITTRVEVAREKRGVCEDMHMPCSTADDCSKSQGATCSENKLCMEQSWCPVQGEIPEVYKLQSD